MKTENSYFPLINGATYYYNYFFDEKKGEQGIIVRKKTKNIINKIFYFDRIGTDRRVIGSNMFGLGAYIKKNNNIYTIYASTKDDLKKIKIRQKQLLIPQSINKEKSIILLGPDSDSNYTIYLEEYENIDVPAGRFDNCLKIKILTKWNSGEEYVDYIWLAKNIGLVKWHRGTGRVDELLNYSIP